MRLTKLAALVAVLAGGAWIAAGVLSWDETGLSDESKQIWWGGLGAFALASALLGYASVTSSPIWLRAIVFLGAAALGGSIVASFDIDMEQAPVVVVSGGGAVLLAGLVGLVVRRRSSEPDEDPAAPSSGHKGGRRAAR